MTSENHSNKNFILRFLAWDAVGGVLLMASTMAALIVANGPFAELYQSILHETYFRVGFTEGGVLSAGIEKTVLHWINDWLMVFFFMLVGLEIKREMIDGALDTPRKAVLPLICAIGGMAVPALIFAFVNKDSPETMAGWAIPGATDIAFVLGILSLLGNRVPVSIKILFLAAAIIDDLGAIIIIALFYTDHIATNVVLFCILPVLGMITLNRMKVWQVGPYLALGTILWAAVLESGVHATLAGVITALFIPYRGKEGEESPLIRLEHYLSPWIMLAIMPIFAFANAGVPLQGLGLDALFHPLTLGISLGLVVGKQVGIFGTLWLCVKTGISDRPEGATWPQLYAMAVLCGIGFTMSLFIGGLAFPDNPDLQNSVRLGVLAGSFISAVAGYILFRITTQKEA